MLSNRWETHNITHIFTSSINLKFVIIMISFLTKKMFKYLSSCKTKDVDQSLEQVMMIELKELIQNYFDVRGEEEQNAAHYDKETKDSPIDSSWVIVDSREGKFK